MSVDWLVEGGWTGHVTDLSSVTITVSGFLGKKGSSEYQELSDLDSHFFLNLSHVYQCGVKYLSKALPNLAKFVLPPASYPCNADIDSQLGVWYRMRP